MEAARNSVRPGDVYHLLKAMDVRSDIRDSLVDQARDARIRQSAATTSVEAIPYAVADLELAASEIRILRNDWIPFVIQTPSYIEMIYKHFHSNASLQELVQLRLQRQAAAFGNPSRFHLIIDEAVFRRPLLPQRQWLQQLLNVREQVSAETFEFGVLPLDESLPIVVSSWETFDRDAALLEEGERVAMPTDFGVINECHKQFDLLEKCAVYGKDAVKLVDEAIKRFETIDLRDGADDVARADG